jgi:O-antigen/teichoic acid export membrane protein
MKSSLARNASWMLFGQGLGFGVRLVYFVVLARLLGVVQYGVIVGAFALVNLVSPYCQLGMGTLLLRYVSADRNQFPSFWGNVLVVTLTTSGLVVVALGVIAPHVLDRGSAAVIVLTGVAMCLCEQLNVSATQVFQAFQDMRTTAILNQLTSVLRTVTAVGMWITLHRVTANEWCLAMVGSSVLAMAISITAVTIRYGRPQFVPRLLLKHGREGLEYAFACSTASAYNDLDKTMLSHYGVNTANGVYSMAYRIIDMATVPIISLQFAAEPRLFQLAASGINQAVVLGQRLLRRGLAASILVAIMMFAAAPIVPLVVGKGFSDGVSALRWLCLIPVFRSIHSITASVLICTGRQRYRTLTQLVAVILNFLLNLWLIPKYSWHGAAYASLATDGALALMNWSLLNVANRRSAKSVLAEASAPAHMCDPAASSAA